MAQYKVPSGVDPVDFLLRENAELKNRVQALEGRKLQTWDRYDHNEVAAPVEGQHVVNMDDESVYYYSNGAWRSLGVGTLQWCRRKRTATTQTIAGNSSQVTITYETTANDYTDYFTAVTVGGLDAGIRVDQAGFYSILCRVFCGTLASEFAISLWGIDPDSWGPYQMAQSDLSVSTEVSGLAAVCVRLAAAQTIFATIRQDSGSDKTIDVGTYLEVVRFPGNVTTTGRLADS